MQTTLIILLLTVPFFLLTIWALVDVAQKKFDTMGKKVLWGIIASVPFIGGIVYFIFGFRKGRKPEADSS
ncbi:PLD nuclease N-terminal domain-containing protein [Desulfococcaceae bacterium HSG7]|nr:PLD nuclease N-terminal domain-containing protein [Desulfococcaceae bacterium HSG7]